MISDFLLEFIEDIKVSFYLYRNPIIVIVPRHLYLLNIVKSILLFPFKLVFITLKAIFTYICLFITLIISLFIK